MKRSIRTMVVGLIISVAIQESPAPITEIPEKPSEPLSKKRATSPSRETRTNVFGMIEGKYIGHLRKEEYVAKSNVKLSTGTKTHSHYFIIQGNRFKFFRITKYNPTSAGLSRNWTRLAYTMRWEGVIYPDENGAYLFVPNSIQVVESTPKDTPDSVKDFAENRKTLGTMRWTLYFDAARLIQVSDGETWSLER